MAGKLCPKCGEQTYFKTPTGRKCSICKWGYETGNQKLGERCDHCKQWRVFDDKCKACGAKYGYK